MKTVIGEKTIRVCKVEMDESELTRLVEEYIIERMSLDPEVHKIEVDFDCGDNYLRGCNINITEIHDEVDIERTVPLREATDTDEEELDLPPDIVREIQGDPDRKDGGPDYQS